MHHDAGRTSSYKPLVDLPRSEVNSMPLIPTMLLVFGPLVFLSYCINATPPPVVPAVQSFHPSGGNYTLPNVVEVIVDKGVAWRTDDNGLTMIPPTLFAYAETFASDIKDIFPETVTSVEVISESIDYTQRAQTAYIYLTISDLPNLTYADGSTTTEAYRMVVSTTGVHITGIGPKGAFWATRTLLQGLALFDGRFPTGIILDHPDWATRGIMLDVGRQWYPITFLQEMCAYLSWFKMDEFHLHLSDNISPNGNRNAYARFRLNSENPEFAGLTPHVNETYSRAEFDNLQKVCADRGVTVVPEIEYPGHALVMTQWKPEFAQASDPSLINLTVSDAMSTIKSVWGEFEPWFHTKEVSIGADEYPSNLADDYNHYVNNMSNFLQSRGKAVRIWNTNESSKLTSIRKNVIHQHWEWFEGSPLDLLTEGYKVINSDDAFNYIVIKQSGSYPQRLNQTRLWDGANTVTGGIWDPRIFDRGSTTDNPHINNPLLKGSIMAVWNDHGPNASTYLEAFYAIKEGLPVMAAVQWQAASRTNHLTREQFLAGYNTLEANAPGQNLDRRVQSHSDLVVKYALSGNGGVVKDQSGNGYDGQYSDGAVVTPLGSKGHNYTFLIETGTQTAGTLLSGPDTSFGYTAYGAGRTLAFTSSNITYPLFDYTLQDLRASRRQIIVLGTENRTSVHVDGQYVGDFSIKITANLLEPMSFVAPVQTIRGARDEVTKFILWDGLQDVSKISEFN